MRISLTSAVVANPSTAQHVSVRAIHIDLADKSIIVEWELVAPDGQAIGEPRSDRFKNPTVTMRVDNMLAAITTALTAKLGVAGTLDS